MDDKLKYRIEYWIPGSRKDLFFESWNEAVEAKIALQTTYPDHIYMIKEVNP